MVYPRDAAGLVYLVYLAWARSAVRLSARLPTPAALTRRGEAWLVYVQVRCPLEHEWITVAMAERARDAIASGARQYRDYPCPCGRTPAEIRVIRGDGQQAGAWRVGSRDLTPERLPDVMLEIADELDQPEGE